MTKITGVSWHKRDSKWVAHIRYMGERLYLGGFIIFENAVKARYKAELKYGFTMRNSSAKRFLRNLKLIK